MAEKYNTNFDEKAKGWDAEPMHWDRSKAVAEEIKDLIPLNKKMIALEYGAGTGITSFLLKDLLKKIILMDNSAEMVRIVNEKISASNVKNMTALKVDLESSDYNQDKFDLIFTQMVLHHVADTKQIIGKFGKMLKPGGYLAIADLYVEDGSFHGEGFIGHNGFSTDKLTALLKSDNFTEIQSRQCFVIDKKLTDGNMKKFGVFILTGKKS
jgi:tRNA (cmo5U34)-methyltransferase